MNKIIIILLALLLWLIPEKLSAIIVWQSMGPSGGGSMETARFHPTDPDTIFVGGDVSGIHKTTDGGATWTMANRGLATTDGTANAYGILSIAISESNPEIMFIGTWRGVYKSADGGENWSLRRPSSPSAPELPIGAVAIDPDDPQRIFAGEGDYLGTDPGTGRFNRSTDGGDTWTVISGTGIDSQAKFSSILIDPTSPAANRAIFAATDKGVYKSADNGSTWSSATAGLPHGDSWTMTLQRTGSNVTLYLSLKIHGTAGAPATYSGGIFKSVDRGNSWQDVTGNLPRYDDWGGGEFYWYDWYHLTTHPGNPDIAYVGTYNDNGHDYNGIWKTTDGGSSWAWTTKTNPSNVQSGWIDFWDEGAGFLALSPSQPDVMVYGASELYKTTDAGSSWQQFYCDSAGGDYWRGRGLEVTYVYTLAFDPQTAGRWYVGYEDILFIKTNDDGQSYKNTYTDSPPEDANDAITAIFVDPDVPSVIYASFAPQGSLEYDDLSKGGVFKSSDYGDTWSQLGAGALPAGRNIIALDPSSSPSSRTIYAAIYGQGVYKTIDGGGSWTPINTGLGSDKNYAAWLKIDPNQSQSLYLGINTKETGTGGLYRTANGGGSWSRLTNFPSYDVLAIEVDPNDSNTVYASGNVPSGGGYEGGLYKSGNGGGDWSEILDEPWVNDVAVHPVNSRIVYAVSSQWWSYSPSQSCGFYKSSDGGSTWTIHNRGLGSLYLYCVEIDPHSPDKIYVGTHGCGFYRGIDTTNPVIESGDYDGDGTSDIGIFRENSGLWAIRGITRSYFGGSSDEPVSGDYDGDGTADIGIFRGAAGLWAIRGVTRTYFGSASDRPVPGDYDGDGACDTGVFREGSGLWAIRGVTRIYFGTGGDSPVPGYYVGGGAKDIGIFRPATGLWAIRGITRSYFGGSSDEPVPGDYDGNGTWEVGIFRPASGLWALRGVTRVYFGSSSDQPVPADYNGNSIDDIGIFRGSSGLWAARGVTRVYFGSTGDVPVTR